ncbi:GntR family transcriptional regulator [Desulforamulus ferrireducens]|uniref:GntR family transcriptional regulator n=1 Tax=Desulforamulus ferrireducens TaxID=1833852 RepID=A0A1S6ISU1_9FIRM|nr:GntR family transcriptional regulator [Desulforamulus ferrireducens]AQS57849.1 GntR family transcriptional regulator [Desulforamulus ferrireducens]
MAESRLDPIQLDAYKPLREIVFETLREAILSGKLEPGERLMEIQLAEEMGVSRTPVREAIRKLELEGFVVMIPRKGAYVAGISQKDVTDVFEVRAALEALAAGLAAERATDEEIEQLDRSLLAYSEQTIKQDINGIVKSDTDFHDLLYKCSRNARLETIITHLREIIQRVRTVSLSQPGRSRDAVEEHRQIVDAIAERNVELAQNLAREHIYNAENSLLKSLKGAQNKHD